MRAVEVAVEGHDDGEAEGHGKEAGYDNWDVFFSMLSRVVEGGKGGSFRIASDDHFDLQAARAP